MPVPYLEKLAKEGHGSIESLERKWSEAKQAAAREGHGDDYAYITGILKRSLQLSNLSELVTHGDGNAKLRRVLRNIEIARHPGIKGTKD